MEGAEFSRRDGLRVRYGIVKREDTGHVKTKGSSHLVCPHQLLCPRIRTEKQNTEADACFCDICLDLPARDQKTQEWKRVIFYTLSFRRLIEGSLILWPAP